MKGKLKTCIIVIMVFLFFTHMINSCSQNTSAITREFEEDITIPSNEHHVLELSFSEGQEFEFIYSLEVKQGGPIDVWFVNYANYVRLMDGNEFLFYKDGSEQDIKITQKVVTVTQHDAYALILSNYNNQTVDVYISYDINIYPEEETSDETSVWLEPYVMLPLGLIIGIIVTFFGYRMRYRSNGSKGKSSLKKNATKDTKKKSSK